MPVITPGIPSSRRIVTPGLIGYEAPRISWSTFLDREFNWDTTDEGEHIGLIGPTGQGKTTLLLQLLPLKKYVAVAATKPRDKIMNYLITRHGYLKLERWRDLDPRDHPRRVVWPDATSIDSEKHQSVVFSDMLARIYKEGNWTLAIDELWYFDQVLGLRKDIQVMLLQSRSLGISLVASTQRPAWVPRELYTSATHLFFWRTNDETDLKSLSGIGFRSARLISEIVANLDQYETLYINTRTGRMCRTKVPKGV
jgi:energy-coupling factor transporter ATP-binding protein EcfA2